MNAMSVSPVKPPLNPGSHAVSAPATNLSKPPLPPGNNFTPLNLIPEAKTVPPVTISSSPEKSVDLCSKPPTSNGTMFPLSESNTVVSPSNTPNCVENNETAENLTTNSVQKSVEVAAVEPKPVVNVIEDRKSDLKINQIVTEDAAIAARDIPAQIDSSVGDVPNNVDIAAKEEKELATPVDNIPNNVDVTPTKSELVSETLKQELPLEQKNTEERETLDDETDSVSTDAPKNTTPKATKRKAKPIVESTEEDTGDRKSKRVRLPTQPYQSPIPELQLIAKLNTPAKATPKNAPERIIAFFKNEFLAVRNPEGSFYICQTFQNIHKNSTKIKIRWFTNLPQDVFTPDFCDTTEFDCILTNVTMTRMEKDRWKLPDHERTRIENILKRALDVEKGVVSQPSVTEEHPDGLDLSLFKDEAQLKKRKKKSATSPKKKDSAADDTSANPSTTTTTATPKKKKSKAKVASKSDKSSGTKKSSRLTANQNQTIAGNKDTKSSKKDKKEKKSKRSSSGGRGGGGKNSKKSATSSGSAASTSTKQSASDKTSSKTWEPSVKASNSSRVVLSLKKENASKSSTSPSSVATNSASASAAGTVAGESKPTKRTSSVSLKAGSTSLATPPPAQKRRKEEPKTATTTAAAAAATAASTTPTTTERTGKVRNAGSAVTAKINSAAMRTTKEKERKSTSTNAAAAAAAAGTVPASNPRKK